MEHFRGGINKNMNENEKDLNVDIDELVEEGEDSDTLEGSDSNISDFTEKKKRRKAVVWSFSSKVGYMWDIIRNIIVIFILLAIFDSIYNSFETITVSLLVLIYLAVVGYGAMLSQGQVRSTLQIYSQVMGVKKQIGSEKDEDEKEELEKAGFLLEKATYKLYINSFFNLLIFIGVVVALLDIL